MACNTSAAWSNCLNKLCIINPDSITATCFCTKVGPTIDKDTFVTLGGNCDHSVCSDSLWSAATVKSVTTATDYFNAWIRKNNSDVPIKEMVYCED